MLCVSRSNVYCLEGTEANDSIIKNHMGLTMNLIKLHFNKHKHTFRNVVKQTNTSSTKYIYLSVRIKIFLKLHSML